MRWLIDGSLGKQNESIAKYSNHGSSVSSVVCYSRATLPQVQRTLKYGIVRRHLYRGCVGGDRWLVYLAMEESIMIDLDKWHGEWTKAIFSEKDMIAKVEDALRHLRIEGQYLIEEIDVLPPYRRTY